MIDLTKFKEFEWDKDNVDKSYEKHGITPNESEEVFVDEELLFIEDIKHSQEEKRFIVIGRNFREIILFVSFTMRNKKIRVISARKASQKEGRQYEKKA